MHSHLWIFKTVPHSMIYTHNSTDTKKIQSTWSALIASLLYKYIYIPFSDVRYFSTNVLHTWWLAKLSLSISIFLFFFYLFFFLFISSNNHTTSTIFFNPHNNVFGFLFSSDDTNTQTHKLHPFSSSNFFFCFFDIY